MLLVLCDEALVPKVREWCRDALRTGLTSVAGEVALADDVAGVPQPGTANDPCLVWLGSSADRDVIETAAAAASQIVLVLGSAPGGRSRGGRIVAHQADAWKSVATVTVPRVAVWLPAADGARADPTGELSSALGAERVVRISRVGSRRAHRQLHRLGRMLVAAACAPQRLDRSDGVVRRRNAAKAATDALSGLLAETDVEEFQIRGGESMLVQYAGGRVERRPSPFTADEELIEAVRFLASYSGDRPQRFDELDPRLDVRVGNRWRLHAEAFVTSPPNVVLRSNMAGRMHLDDLGVVSAELGGVLIEAIAGRVRANVVVAAAMGGGKTTLCQALLAAVPDHERIDTIEDTPELRLAEYDIHPNTFERLTRDPNQDGHGRHSMADHIRDAKRANASKLVVGEIRGDGCEALLDAMSSGLDGCLVTLHSQPGKGVLEKLVAYACSEGAEPDYARRQIAAAVDLCVWMGRNDAGERVVADVTQLTGIDDVTGIISTTCLWALRPGDRWATPVSRPVGRVAHVYASVGLSEVGGDAELPDVFSQIVDMPVPLTAGVPNAAADPPAPTGEELDDAASANAMPPYDDASVQPDDHRAMAPTEPSTPNPAQHDEPHDGEPLFGALSHDRAEAREVLWDPGPLVPFDKAPPYEPLVGESWTHPATVTIPGQCAAIGPRLSGIGDPGAGDETHAEGITC